MQKVFNLSVIFIIFLLVVLPLGLAVTGQLTGTASLKYVGTASDPGFYYQDGVGGSSGNVDVGIKLCDVGQQYVGGFYALHVDPLWYYTLVSYSSSSNALALTSNDVGGGCYEAPAGYVTISPSVLTTPNPNVYRAALPGNLWIGYDTVANPGPVANFVYSSGQAKLQGDYSVTRSFDQASRQISVQTPTISFTSTSGSFTKSASDGTHGINAERQMLIGVCDDDYGYDCSDGTLLTSATFPQVFSSGLVAGQVNDQQTHTKYVVLNGIGKSMCIGSNLKAVVTSISPSVIYYNQTLEINFSIVNDRNTPYELLGGNVDVTSDFDVRVSIYKTGNSSNQVYTNTVPVHTIISPDGTYSLHLNWNAIAHSGEYTILIEADVNDDIVECVESDNTASGTFELLPITMPTIYIDGVKKDSFDYPNVPYNLSFHLENSDGDILSNSTIILTETNGLSLAMPTQIYNLSTGPSTSIKSGVVTTTQASFTTDYEGNVSISFIPTYNPLYTSTYSYVQLEDYVGDYALGFSGNQENGDAFKFVLNGTLYSNYKLNLLNTSYNGTYLGKTVSHEAFVSQVLDFAYHAYANFLEVITG